MFHLQFQGSQESGGRASSRKNIWLLRVLKSCFNALVLSSLKYCTPCRCRRRRFIIVLFIIRWVYNSTVCSTERLRDEGELCCLGHRRKVSILCSLYKIYHRVDLPLNDYLNRFVAARNTRTSTALDELALVIPRCRTDQVSRPLLPAAVRLWNLLPCLVVTHWAILWTCAYWGLSLFFPIYFSFLLLLHSLPGMMVRNRHTRHRRSFFLDPFSRKRKPSLPFSRYMCQIILMIIVMMYIE